MKRFIKREKGNNWKAKVLVERGKKAKSDYCRFSPVHLPLSNQLIPNYPSDEINSFTGDENSISDCEGSIGHLDDDEDEDDGDDDNDSDGDDAGCKDGERCGRRSIPVRRLLCSHFSYNQPFLKPPD